MNIPWQYIDKRSATINALKDYEGMKHILGNTVEKISSSTKKGQTRKTNSEEERLVRDIDVLSTRFQEAKEYMDWFQPGWDALSEDERFALTQYYQSGKNSQTDNIYEICDHFHIERSTAYKKKDQALAHLTLLLYGK